MDAVEIYAGILYLVPDIRYILDYVEEAAVDL